MKVTKVKYYVPCVVQGDYRGAIVDRPYRIESEECVYEMVEELQQRFETEEVVPQGWEYLCEFEVETEE